MNEKLKLIDEIFGDASIKHGLTVFNVPEMQSLNLFDSLDIYRRSSDDRIVIKCLKRNREIVAKPEEIVRQLFLIYVCDFLNYPLPQVNVEEKIQMGSDDSKRGDIVIFTDDTCTQKYIVFEIKKPDA